MTLSQVYAFYLAFIWIHIHWKFLKQTQATYIDRERAWVREKDLMLYGAHGSAHWMNLHNNNDSNDDDVSDNDDHDELNGTDFDAALLSTFYSSHSLHLKISWIVFNSFNLFQSTAIPVTQGSFVHLYSLFVSTYVCEEGGRKNIHTQLHRLI